MLHTTFALAKQAGACTDSYRKYAKHIGGVRRYGQNTPIPLTDILDVLGVEDALWCLRCVLPEQSSERDRLATLLAADFAEHVAPLWVAPEGVIWRPEDTISVVRRYANGLATHGEMRAAEEEAGTAEGIAWEAAWTAWEAARTAEEAARTTARTAARTARTARTAARTAWETAGTAWAAARTSWEAARTAEAVRAAARAVRAAARAVREAREAGEAAREAARAVRTATAREARAAAWATERSWQAQRLRERLTEEAI